MIAVTFRFYAQLNDFLPAARRHHRFGHQLVGPGSIKDAIESLGIPHPEVDLILVNGTAVDFDYRIRDGDDVTAYPAFRTIDLVDADRVGVAPVHPICFVVDVHLGRLASLLRLAGFDAVVVEDDEEAAARAASDRRVLLTRDVGLLKRAVVAVGHWVRSTEPEQQFVEVLERYDLVDQIDAFTRCLKCNTTLIPAEPSIVVARVPPRARQTFDDFRECEGCGRIYWRGSHYARLLDLLERARKRASGGF